MAQHDLEIANQTASSARTDINNALSALGSTLSGTSAPSTTTEGTLWYDTTNNQLRVREGSTWVVLGTVSGTSFYANVQLASQGEAQAGTENTKTMTALRVKEAITQNTTNPIGVSQTWQSFSSTQRVSQTSTQTAQWYQNTTTQPIQVAINILGGNGYGEPAIYVGTATNSFITLATWSNQDGRAERFAFSFIVPVNHYYKLTSGTRVSWSELRA